MTAIELLKRLPTQDEVLDRLAEIQRERRTLRKLLELDLPERPTTEPQDATNAKP